MTALQTLPRAPDQSDKQTRLFIDMAGAILNALVRSGAVTQTGPQEWQLVAGGTLAALSVLGRAGNTPGAAAAIVAASDYQVFRRSGTGIGFGAVNLAQSAAVTGDLPYANIVPATAASKLLGRGSASGAGDWQEISIGFGTSMNGTTLESPGGASGPTAVNAEQIVASYAIAAATGVWVNTGVSQLALPNVGTYRVSANLRWHINSASGAGLGLGARLYDTTNSAAVTNSERLLCFLPSGNANSQATVGLEWLVTTAGTNVLMDLSLVRNGSFTDSDILSSSDGRSTFSYVQYS